MEALGAAPAFRYAESEAVLTRALGWHRRVRGARHPDTLTTLHNLGTALLLKGQYEQAVTAYRTCAEWRTATLGALHEDTLESLHRLGEALRCLGE